MPLSRRGFLFASVSIAATLGSRIASASIARAVALSELCRGSERAVVARAVDAQSRWESVAGRRRIVTYTRLVVDETVAGPSDSELIVRTLGGQVGDVGQVVFGEALLLIDEPALLFLTVAPDGVSIVTEMAQGHYPIRAAADGQKRLVPSPRAPELSNVQRSAASKLVGKTPSDAVALTRKAWADAH
jgi:hypothetical protein